jgi:hypothetical protein
MRINWRFLGQWLAILLATPIWLTAFAIVLIQDAWNELRPARPTNTCHRCQTPLPPSHQCPNCK